MGTYRVVILTEKKTSKKTKQSKPISTSSRKVAKQKSNTKKPNDNEKLLAMFAHLLGLLITWGWLGSLIIYLVKKDEPGFAKENARHALNFQISLLIYGIISGILIVVVIGFLLLGVLGIIAIVLPIVAAVKAHEGRVYEYPLEIKFIKK